MAAAGHSSQGPPGRVNGIIIQENVTILVLVFYTVARNAKDGYSS